LETEKAISGHSETLSDTSRHFGPLDTKETSPKPKKEKEKPKIRKPKNFQGAEGE